jgi:tetratricopeptide (TPR) repeat protein
VQRFAKYVAAAGMALAATSCALYSDVSITPLPQSPAGIDRGSDLQSMVRKYDYLRAIELTSNVETRQRPNVADLTALGEAELISGRYDAARQHLRAAIDLEPFHTTFSQIAWDLSQVEYMTNNYESSLEWAQLAVHHGLSIKQWHLDYLQALAATDVYHFDGMQSDRVQMHVGRPDVPRIDVRLEGRRNVGAVIDSGAVLSIVSEKLAQSFPVQRLGTFEGTFYGLLGEPISVHFGLLKSLEIGGIVIQNVPVAIMPDDKMRFLVSANREFNMDFLLGANLLKEFRIEFDFKRGSAMFTRLTAEDRQPDPNQNLFIRGFRPMVRGLVNRKGWYLFELDTGSEVTFLNAAQLRALPIQLYAPKLHAALLQGLGGAKKRGEKLENIEIALDKWGGVFRTLPMYESVSDQERAVGIVGENYLKNFRVVLDFGRMRLDLIRS